MKKLLLLPALFTALSFSLVMADAKAVIIEVPYEWSYSFSGSCVLGCNTNDVFGNPIASQGATFGITLFNGINFLPQSWGGFDLTNGDYTPLFSTPASVLSDPSENLVLFSDLAVFGPGFEGLVTGGFIPVNGLGNVTTGIFSGTNGSFSGPPYVSYDLANVEGFATTFNVTYSAITENDDNRVPVEDQNTPFYTDENYPFWQGIGTWTREIRDTVPVQFNDTVSVPEPSTLFLMGAGLLGLVGARKKV